MPFTIPNLADAGFAAQAAPDSGDLAILVNGFGRSGVLTGCGVTAATLMNVAVAAGTIEVGAVAATVSANAALAVGAAHATLPRIDLIYSLAAGTPTVAAGTAVSNPAYPALPADSVILAAVYVPALLTTILSSHLTDKRVFLSAASNVTGWVVYDGTAGAIASATANVTAWNTAVAALPAAGGTIFVKAGTYWLNFRLELTRNHVKILGEPGACFKMLGGSATNVSTTGTNYNILCLGNLGGTPECTDITVEGIEFDGNCVLQDLQNAPSTTNSTTSKVLLDGVVASFTNTTNAVITMTSAGWTTNQWAGLLLSMVSGTANADYKVITSNTATTITLVGVFAVAPTNGDSFRIMDAQYQRALVSATNTTNAVLTGPAAAVWGTTRYVGFYVNFFTGPAAGVSKLITAHTNTTITVSGTYASPPVAGNQFQISTQPMPPNSSWESTGNFGACAIVARDCYRVDIRDNYIHDMFGTGIELNLTGAATVTENVVNNTGLQFVLGPGNGISCSAYGANPGFPSSQIIIGNNTVTRVGDVGIDIHGAGTTVVTCAANTVQGKAVSIGGSDFHAGILVEIETADSRPNIGTEISGNNVDDLSVGISLANSGNNAQYFAAVNIIGNVITNCLAGCYIEGAHINVDGNTFFMVGCGVSANNANAAAGASVERDWNISNNTFMLDPKQIGFGNCCVFLRWQPIVATSTIATISSGTNASPIVLTHGGWTGGQPTNGTILVFATETGTGTVLGSFVGGAIDATHATLNQSTGNGTITGGTLQGVAHLLDAVNVTSNVMQGQGSVNTGSTHAGVYIEAMASGTANSSIQHVQINSNLIHGFQNGIFIQSDAANTLINEVDIRDNRIWNSNAWAIQLSGTQIRGTIIENNSVNDTNVSGSLTGMTTGAYTNTSTVDVIRDNRGHNPNGLLTLPYGRIVATPITTTVYTNDTGYDCTVYILGTITVISVGGQTTGLTASTTVGASVRVVVGQTLAITGSASLSWKWFAD